MTSRYPAPRRQTTVRITDPTLAALGRMRADAGVPQQTVMEALIRVVDQDDQIRRRVLRLAKQIHANAIARAKHTEP